MRFYSLNKLCSKQSLPRSLWKKVRRLEKSTPTPLQALLTNMSYGADCVPTGLPGRLLPCEWSRFVQASILRYFILPVVLQAHSFWQFGQSLVSNKHREHISKHRKNCECCHHHSVFKSHNVIVHIVVLNCQKCNQCLKCQVSGHKNFQKFWKLSKNLKTFQKSENF